MFETEQVSLNREDFQELLDAIPEKSEIPLRVTGLSMMPTLFHQRSVVFLFKDRDYQPTKGDIVLFRRTDGAFVLHRIRKVLENDRLTINGDAQRWCETIQSGQICAHVTHFIRRKKDISCDGHGYRSWVRFWMACRPIHPIVARAVYIWHRIPEKIFHVNGRTSS